MSLRLTYVPAARMERLYGKKWRAYQLSKKDFYPSVRKC